VQGYSVSGPNASSFVLGALKSDSLSITFITRSLGDLFASIIIQRTDDAYDTVALHGVSAGGGAFATNASLFSHDTVNCVALTRTLGFRRTGCTPPSVISSHIVGPDASSFTPSALTPDSVLVTFNPTRSGDYRAALILTLTDGTYDTVALGDIYNAVGSFSVTSDTLVQFDTSYCDTIQWSLHLRYAGCAPPIPLRWSVIGSDSMSFQMASVTRDSVAILFGSAIVGAHQASLVCELSDGTSDTIALHAFSGTTPLTYSLSSLNMFSTDSLYLCDHPIRKTVAITTDACPRPDIVSQGVSGSAASDYSVVKQIASPIPAVDSATLMFLPRDSGPRSASYDLTLSDGTQISIPLSGYGLPSRQLALQSTDVSPTTIGGTVDVPLTINGLARAEDIELVAHYDGGLPYRGSFSAASVSLDLPGEQWQGRSKLRILQAMPGQVAGYARFEVYEDSLAKPMVWFDSVVVLSPMVPCEYLLPAPVSSSITLPTACGITMLSKFIHSGTSPTFRVSPNPTNGDVAIESSSDLGDVSIAIFDMLGTQRGTVETMLAKDAPVTFSMPPASGLYYLRIKSGFGTQSLNVIVNR